MALSLWDGAALKDKLSGARGVGLQELEAVRRSTRR
jgi:hypothetical protein